jgi:hypothetical protein
MLRPARSWGWNKKDFSILALSGKRVVYKTIRFDTGRESLQAFQNKGLGRGFNHQQEKA